MNTKAKGSRAERRARHMLEAAGCTVVRAGASLGLFDLVAFNRVRLVLVQVKTNRGPGPTERERLRAFNNLPPNARKQVWVFFDRMREPRIEELESWADHEKQEQSRKARIWVRRPKQGTRKNRRARPRRPAQ